MQFSRSLFAAAALASFVGAQTNLLVNPGAETGSLSGWTDALGNGFGVSTAPLPVFAGTFVFHPGFTGPLSTAFNNELRQDVGVSSFAAEIAQGRIRSSFHGYGYSAADGSLNDPGRFRVEFLDTGGVVLDTFDSGIFMPFNTWVPVTDDRILPVGTTTIRVVLDASRLGGSSTDAFFDDLSLELFEADSVASGCLAGGPSLGVVTQPRLGDTYALEAQSVVGSSAGMILGFSPTVLDLTPFGFAPGCDLLVGPVVAEPLIPAGGVAQWSIDLPPNPVFAGSVLYNQLVELRPSGRSSNRIAATLQ